MSFALRAAVFTAVAVAVVVPMAAPLARSPQQSGIAANHPSTHQDSVLIIPATFVRRALTEERNRAGAGPMQVGYQLLEELTTPSEPGKPRPTALVLTPQNASQLVRNGMRPFLIDAFRRFSPQALAGVSLQAVKDNTLFESATGDLSNGAGEAMYIGMSGAAGGDTIRRGVVSFDVAGTIAPGSTVTAATLTFNVTNTSGGPQTVDLYRLTADWGEGASDSGAPGGAGAPTETGDATWIHTFATTSTWASPGGDFDPTVSATQTVDGGGSYTWSAPQLVTDVQDMLDNPATDFGWIIRGNETTPNTAKRFDSKDNATFANRPILTVTTTTVDTDPPMVTVVFPNGGQSFPPEEPVTLEWTAMDASGIAFIDVFVSVDGGATYQPVALGLAGTDTSFEWFPPDRPTMQALIKVEATDNAFNTGGDESDDFFTVEAICDALVDTTLRDFDQPGTQPLEQGLDIRDPSECMGCHSGYDENAEPFFAWSGSMMANASRDPLFEACLTIAEQDACGSGDLCIRCHVSKAWLNGRSTPTDGQRIEMTDMIGVSCDLCHRMLDPIYEPGVSPPEDAVILAALSNPPTEFGNGMYVVDPDGIRRGPFTDVICDQAHQKIVSPFHQEAAFCGTCHDVSNPAFETDGMGNYIPNGLDMAATDFSPDVLMPIERTYSEWLNSEYNSPGGVFAPQFGGNLNYVSICQDCHMRDVTGNGCNPAIFPDVSTRDNMPFHDLTGGNTWMPPILADLFPGDVDPAAQDAAAERARYMLQNAATLTVDPQGSAFKVTVTNETGHKLPTGYPEGRRMWLNVKFFDGDGNLVKESGAYDFDTGELSHDAEAKIYEVEAGLDETLSALSGEPVGPSFHFVLNNKIFKDNRIPPRGFTNAAFAAFGGAPVEARYADGQFWDDTTYGVPDCAVNATVTLYYQTTSKEYVEFLRDRNYTDEKGQMMYDIWLQYDKAPPEVMATVDVGIDRIEAFLDIKPGSCPNSYNPGSHGVLPVALVGSRLLDVTKVDISTVRLVRADCVGGAVSPNQGPMGRHPVFDDVATPFLGKDCDCGTEGGDGWLDLVMKFRTDEVREVLMLDRVGGNSNVELLLLGELTDGSAFISHDCLRIVPMFTR